MTKNEIIPSTVTTASRHNFESVPSDISIVMECAVGEIAIVLDC